MEKAENKEVPRYIYKYMSLESFIEMVTQQTLYFATPIIYNDPFDTKVDIIYESTLEKKKDFWKTFGREDDFADRMEEVPNPILKTMIDEAYTDVLSKFRVCCFCQGFDNILMWSHYSNMHKGVCVKFDRAKDELFNDVMPISYNEQLPKYNLVEGTLEDVRRTIYIKSKDWEYEKEMRIVKHIQQGVDNKVKFKKKALCEVILGCRFPEYKKLAVQAIIKKYGYHTTFSQMDMSQSEYRLIRKQLR